MAEVSVLGSVTWLRVAQSRVRITARVVDSIFCRQNMQSGLGAQETTCSISIRVAFCVPAGKADDVRCSPLK